MLRRMIAAAMRAVSRFTLRTVERIVDGVRVVLSVFVPVQPTEMLDVAETVIAEERSGPAADPIAEAVVEARREIARPSEAERVRRAASILLQGRQVPESVLDPADAAEAEVLKWLMGLDALHLGTIAKAGDLDIDLHLAGERRLRAPLLPRAEARAEENREKKRPPTYPQWIGILLAEAHAAGDDDPNLDDLFDRAAALTERNLTVEEYKSSMPAARVSEGEDA